MNIKLKQQLQKELDNNQLWRVKEILRSRISSENDFELYFEYGKLLYQLYDYYEAGKYLFIGRV